MNPEIPENEFYAEKTDMRQASYSEKTHKKFKSRQNLCSSHGKGSTGGKRKSGMSHRKGCGWCKIWGGRIRHNRGEVAKQIHYEENMYKLDLILDDLPCILRFS